MQFGRPLANFWFPLGSIGLPFAALWLPLDDLLATMATVLALFDSLKEFLKKW